MHRWSGFIIGSPSNTFELIVFARLEVRNTSGDTFGDTFFPISMRFHAAMCGSS
jgi:hypothetical protein